MLRFGYPPLRSIFLSSCKITILGSPFFVSAEPNLSLWYCRILVVLWCSQASEWVKSWMHSAVRSRPPQKTTANGVKDDASFGREERTSSPMPIRAVRRCPLYCIESSPLLASLLIMRMLPWNTPQVSLTLHPIWPWWTCIIFDYTQNIRSQLKRFRSFPPVYSNWRFRGFVSLISDLRKQDVDSLLFHW